MLKIVLGMWVIMMGILGCVVVPAIIENRLLGIAVSIFWIIFLILGYIACFWSK